MYGAYNIKGELKIGEVYSWCTCGFSREEPWCDRTCEQDKPDMVDENGERKYRPYRFQVNKDQTVFSICGCKYTQTPPVCDGTHGPMPVNPPIPPCRCDLPADTHLSW